MTKTTYSFTLSSYQKKILSWLSHNRERHLMVNAVAGSGKSTTLKQIAISLHIATAKAVRTLCEAHLPWHPEDS